MRARRPSQKRLSAAATMMGTQSVSLGVGPTNLLSETGFMAKERQMDTSCRTIKDMERFLAR
jgi:hypothetical protein